MNRRSWLWKALVALPLALIGGSAFAAAPKGCGCSCPDCCSADKPCNCAGTCGCDKCRCGEQRQA